MAHIVYEESADGNVIAHAFKEPHRAHVLIKKLLLEGQKEVYELFLGMVLCNYNINDAGRIEYVDVVELPERIRIHLLLGAIQ